MADRVVHNGISIREENGRSGRDAADSRSAERVFLVKGDTDPTVCRQALDDQTFYDLATYDNLILKEVSWKRIGDESWHFTCDYTNDDFPANPGDFTVTMDSTGGLIKITEAYEQTKYNAPGETAPDYNLSLNVQDGKPEGMDVIIPALKLNVAAKISSAYITTPIAYAKIVASMTGYTNNAPMLDGEFAAGELLFAGATGPIITTDDPILNFAFIASPNLVGATIGGTAGIAKDGHEYAWVSYRNKKDATTGLQVQVARGVYIGRVYDPADHSLMKIGVA